MAKKRNKKTTQPNGADRDLPTPEERKADESSAREEDEQGVSGMGMDLMGRSYDDMETMTDIESTSRLANEPDEDEEQTLDLLLDDADLDNYGEKISPYTTNQDIVDDFVDRQTMATDSDNLADRLANYNQLSPNISGGDVDAGWEYGNEVGDETVGGTAPTPDQDVVDDLGEAAGLTYRDDELLNFEKVGDRDTRRWEMNPEDLNEIDDQDLESLDELGEAEEKTVEDEEEEIEAEEYDAEDLDGEDLEGEEDDDLEEDVNEYDLIDLDDELEDFDEDDDLDD